MCPFYSLVREARMINNVDVLTENHLLELQAYIHAPIMPRFNTL